VVRISRCFFSSSAREAKSVSQVRILEGVGRIFIELFGLDLVGDGLLDDILVLIQIHKFLQWAEKIGALIGDGP
jgi:hypothetical protein